MLQAALDRLGASVRMASFTARSATDEEAMSVPALFPRWVPGVAYQAGERIADGGQLYRVVQGHTSQADWPPAATPALYTAVSAPGDVPNWRQPQGAHDAYGVGDRVRFNGKVYESLIPGNTYSPTDYPAGWKEVS